MPFDNVQLRKAAQTRAEKDPDLTDCPPLIQTPQSEAVHQPDLVVLVTTPPGVLENPDARRQLNVVLVVVSPAS